MKRLFLFLIATVSAAAISAAVPRSEYPRPQFQREQWCNLNGEWDFAMDNERKGLENGWTSASSLEDKIIVPFAPESSLSGVGHTDFITAVWYRREVEVPASWSGKKILLNFGAVDYKCSVYIDGERVGLHAGGTSSFSFDITSKVKAGGKFNLVVYAEDDTRSGVQPLGKQSTRRESHGCFYTRTTGIWQTVWMEAVAPTGLRRVKIIPDVDNSQFVFMPEYYDLADGQSLTVVLSDGGRKVASKTVTAAGASSVVLPVKKPKLWWPESPFLYDVKFIVKDKDGNTVDEVSSYAGLRKFHIEGRRMFLNNEPFYLRTVLDQGFYPDGIWTAPSDEALRADIELSKKAGFNGARLHQKVFEERFHYWADKLGYVTFGEASDWGCNRANPAAAYALVREWVDNVNRDFNHPSIIGWTPMNEAWGVKPLDDYLRLNEDLFNITHLMDATRPVSTASGGSSYKTDIWTVHTYEQDPAVLKTQLEFENGYPKYMGQAPFKDVPYSGQPYFVDEFGGIKWNPAQQTDNVRTESWGYGQAPRSLEEFYERLSGQVDAIVGNPDICGYCYTQFTDVEQEQNGIYFYDRSEKFDMDKINEIFSRRPEGYR
ncbi:MAG: beta-glucuronidase [Alistipes putredinis]|nr:MAG: beta-glucuronidase [Alistipes putredinis]